MSPQVAWLHVAPIKGLAIEERVSIELRSNGVEDDRRYCIVDEGGRMLNAKRAQRFVTIRPVLDEAAGTLELEMPSGKRVFGEIDLGEPLDIRIHRRAATARVVVGPWADALSAEAGEPVRLVKLDHVGSGVDRGGNGGGATLLSVDSLRTLAEAAGVPGPVDPRRFRMLIGVAGTRAHAEDEWIGRPVHVGQAVVVPKGNVGRCAVTTVDPITGVADLDTLKALARYRGDEMTTEPLPFGVWARVSQPGRISIGDEIVA